MNTSAVLKCLEGGGARSVVADVSQHQPIDLIAQGSGEDQPSADGMDEPPAVTVQKAPRSSIPTEMKPTTVGDPEQRGDATPSRLNMAP